MTRKYYWWCNFEKFVKQIRLLTKIRLTSECGAYCLSGCDSRFNCNSLGQLLARSNLSMFFWCIKVDAS